MYDFFKQFGDIKSTMHFGRYGKENYVLVEFARKEVAAQMAMRRGFTINGNKYKVESIEKTDTFIYDLNLEPAEISKPPSNDSSKNILIVLNDDCIGLIFEKISNIRDFHSISNVCVRFNRIARKIFSSKIKRRCVNFGDYLLNDEDLQMVQIENFLCDFGSFVESLEISEHYIQGTDGKSNTLLKIIHKYCKNLRKLDLHVSGVDNQTVSEIQPLLSKLEYLYLGFVCGSDFGSFNEFISTCTQLQTLTITGCRSYDEFSMPNVNFPNLINFKINAADIAIDSFLECNPQIETITVKHPSNVRSFFDHDMPKTQKFSLINPNACITEEQSIHLRSLKKVERMHLEISLDDSIINIFGLKNIMDLTLHIKTTFNEDHLVSLVKNLWHLEEMRIYHDTTYQINLDTIKQMLQHTNQLSYLLILWPINVIQPFDENDYNEMLKFVKNRSTCALHLKFINQTTLFDDTNGLKRKFYLFDEDSQRLRVSNYFEYSY